MSLVFKEINTKGLKGHDVWNLFASSSGMKKKPCVKHVAVGKYRCSKSVHCTVLSTFSVSLLIFPNQKLKNNLQGKKYIFNYGSNNNNKLIH